MNLKLKLTDGYTVVSANTNGRDVRLNGNRTLSLSDFHKLGGILSLFDHENEGGYYCKGSRDWDSLQPTKEALEWKNNQ